MHWLVAITALLPRLGVRRTSCAAIFLLALCEPLAAEDLRFDHLTVADGLAHASVWRIYQDSRGFLWIATESTLQRYDGYELVVYKNDPEDPESISDSKVMAILEDRLGNLWFGTRSRGLNRFDRALERFDRYQSDPDDPGSLTSGIVFRLIEARDGTIWAATLGGGLNRLSGAGAEPDQTVVERFQHDPDDPGSLAHNSVQSILEDRSGALWVGTSGGLDRLDRDRETFIHHLPDSADPSSLSHGTVSALFEDSDGALWVGTWDGTLHRLETGSPGGFVRYRLHSTDPGRGSGFGIWVIHQDDAGDLWLGTNGGGLSRFDRATETFRHFRHDPNDPLSLSSDAVLDIHQDRTGMLWLATRVNVSKLDPRWQQFEVLRHRPGRDDGLVGSEVIALAEDRDGGLWVGTRDTGLTVIERDAPETVDRAAGPGTIVHYRHDPARLGSLPHGTVRALLADRQGELWVGTSGGFGRLVRVPGRPSSEPRRFVAEPGMEGANVTCLLEDSAGDLWLGSESGLYQRAGGEVVKHTHDPAVAGAGADRIYTLYEDPSGRLWLGTGAGLGRFEAGSGDFRHWRHDPEDPDSPGAEVVMAITDDAAGGLWLGTYGGGLDHWQPAASEPASGEALHGTWRHFREKDGLANDHVVGILAGPGDDLWITSNGGLSRFDPRSETFRNYDAGDGLHGNIFYFGARLRTARGELMFGGQGGLTAFFPERLGAGDQVLPLVALTAFRLAGERVSSSWRDTASPRLRAISETRELVLSHQQRTFSFEFAALDYRNPEKTRYAYRLEGYDDDWIETDAGRRLARFTNLDPKEYVFRVKAANKDGAWNEQGASVRITVQPPPWKTWWAYSLYALALAAMVLGSLRWQQARVERERAIAERERASGQQLREANRLQDEFLTERERLIAELEARNSELARFNYTIAHDLKNPLVTIRNFLGLARRDAAAGRAESLASDLDRLDLAADKLQRQLEDLFELSRVGMQVNPYEDVAFGELIEAALKELAGSIAETGVKIEVANDLPPVHGDRIRFQEAVRHLLDNAVRYRGDQAVPRVEVGFRSEGAESIFFVRDNGRGIESRYHERVFGLFERLDPEGSQGTGIGLTLVKRIVEVHGGRIWVESKGAGHGSTFCFTLPGASADHAEPQASIH